MTEDRTAANVEAVCHFLKSELQAEIRFGGGFAQGWIEFHIKKSHVGKLRISDITMADSTPEELIEHLVAIGSIDSLTAGETVDVANIS